MEGASLYSAHLEGANLGAAELQGALLNGAQLQGASLYATQLQGASLRHAHFEGASLEKAQLQGVLLDGAQLRNGELINANVFRTQLVDVDLDSAKIDNPDYAKTVLPPLENVVKLTDALVDKWIKTAIEHVRDEDVEHADERKKQTEQRLNRLLVGGATTEEDARGRNFWNEAAENSRKLETEFPKRLAQQLGDLVCSANGAPYVARALLSNLRLRATGQNFHAIADRMKKARGEPARQEGPDLSACPGVKGFTEEDWRRLVYLDDELRRARSPQVAPANASSATPQPVGW